MQGKQGRIHERADYLSGNGEGLLKEAVLDGREGKSPKEEKYWKE